MSSNLISELRNMLDDIDALGAGPLTVDTHLIREAMAGLILAEQFRGHAEEDHDYNADPDAEFNRLGERVGVK